MKKKTLEEFIKEAREVHGDKYDYSKTEYINARTKVCIICPEHGEFWQKPTDHTRGVGCPHCRSLRMSNDTFIAKAKEVHGNKYDYSKVEYKGCNIPVKIICPIHGEFSIKPFRHLQGQGCKKCAFKLYDKESFIEEARKVHGYKYDYSNVTFINANTKVCIICPEHGEFWQKPTYHVWNKCGCPSCIQSHLENDTRLFLEKNKIKFVQQQMFNWLGLMRLDFYLPEYNMAIECQGEQHFKPIQFFGGKKAFNELIKRDKLKKKLCDEHKLTVLYVNYNRDVLEQLEQIIK